MAKSTTNCSCCTLHSWDYQPPVNDRKRLYDLPKAGAILIYNGRVLIVQSRGKKWGFPKGSFERGECATQCATREVLEETSFNIRFKEDDSNVKYNRTTFYIKHLERKPPSINHGFLKKPGNDCTGIGWIRLTCLNKQSKLNGSIKFNIGVRKFVSQYINPR
jgi:ADP-ribose pyrophosphatase YjhB (NUDIX family)